MMNLLKTAGTKGREEGFTLLEVVVAVVILGLAYVAVMQSLSLSTRNILRIERSGKATFEQTIHLEKILLGLADEEADSEEIYLKGTRLQLGIIQGEDARMKTLKLTEITL
jgi:prepilin-type N-terminal cleavage/methylation domain-containing protein